MQIVIKSEVKAALMLLSINASLMYISRSHADEIVKDFSLPATVQYDDNVTLSPTNSRGAFRYITTPTLTLSSVSELGEVSLKAALNIVRSNASENLILDREDPTLNSSWTRSFDRGNFSLNAGYIRTSTRVSELDQTGLVFRDGNSINRNLGARFNYKFTNLVDTTFNLNYTNQTFTASNLSDFKSYEAGIQVNRQYSENLSLYINAGYSKYKNQQNGNLVVVNQNGDSSQNLKRYALGAAYAYSPTLNVNFSFGGNTVSTGESGWIAGSEVTYQPSEYTKLNATYSRGNYASGLGSFQNSDNVNLSLIRIISDVDDVGCDFSWNRNRNLNTSTTRSFVAFYKHQWSSNWASRLSFQHRGISSGGLDSASGAQLGFTLIYNQLNF